MIKETYKISGNIVFLGAIPKKLKVYRSGLKLQKHEYKVQGMNVIFTDSFNSENVVIQYE